MSAPENNLLTLIETLKIIYECGFEVYEDSSEALLKIS